MKPIAAVLLLLPALVLTSCGGGNSGTPDADKPAGNSAAPSPTESEESAPQLTGTLSSATVPCKNFSAPEGFRQAGAAPPVMCAFETSDARVSVTLGPAPPSFEQLQRFEEGEAQADGVTPPALDEVTVEGWTYAVIWPEADGFNRMDWYLLDASGNALVCKVGVQGGPVDASTHAEFCESARELLYKS